MGKYEMLTKYTAFSIPFDRKTLSCFIEDIYAYVDTHPEYGLNAYIDILTENNIEWSMSAMDEANISILDEKAILALLVGAIRADRFCDGAIDTFLVSGRIHQWLKRLNEFDR